MTCNDVYNIFSNSPSNSNGKVKQLLYIGDISGFIGINFISLLTFLFLDNFQHKNWGKYTLYVDHIHRYMHINLQNERQELERKS